MKQKTTETECSQNPLRIQLLTSLTRINAPDSWDTTRGEVFREGPQFFEICPIFLNFAQYIFPGGVKNFLGGFRLPCTPPGYGPANCFEYLKISVCHFKKTTWSIAGTLWDVTNPDQDGPGNNDGQRVFQFPQNGRTAVLQL